MPIVSTLPDIAENFLQYINSYMEAETWSPSVRELQAHFGYRSTCSPSAHLKTLERAGMIERKNGNGAAIRITDTGYHYLEEAS